MSSEKLKNQSQFIESQGNDIVLHNLMVYHFVEVFIGLSITAYAIFIFENTSHVISIILFCLFLTIIGIYLIVDGLKGLFNRKPKIKLGKQGIWTEKYGFNPWNVIRKTKIVHIKTFTILQIYLISNKTNKPDEEVILSGIEGRLKIEGLISDYKSQKIT